MARAPREQANEVYPEADRLGDFPHPRHTNEFFGHGDAEAQLSAGLADGKLHHAWLLVGPHGVGKATLAYRFARAALAGDGLQPGLLGRPDKLVVSDDSKASHLVRALSHPDLLVIRRPYDIPNKRLKTAITVDEVRRLRDFLGHKQVGGGWKIVIVDAADDLNINAANALLKSLEEPPERVLFFLISSMPGRLLTTIRSRCRLLSMPALGPEDVEAAATQALLAAGLDLPKEQQWPLLIQVAEGSVARLLSLASDDGLAAARKVDAVFANLARTDWAQMHQLSDEFSAVAASDKFDSFVDLLLARLARLVRAGAVGAGDAGDLEAAQKLGITGHLASWAELWETLVREKAMQGALNLDRKAFVLDCIMRIRKLAAER